MVKKTATKTVEKNSDTSPSQDLPETETTVQNTQTEVLVEETTVKEPEAEKLTAELTVETADDVDEDYPITYYKKGPRNWGSASVWFTSAYALLVASFIGIIYMLAGILQGYAIPLETELLGFAVLFLNSWLGVAAIFTGVMGLVTAKYSGFGYGKAIFGILFTLAVTAGAVVLLLLV